MRNELVEENGRIVARPTGETETIECGIVLRSVGYKGVPLAGVPFDEATGTIPNDRGRVVGAERTYAAGWIKRGPSGVIGTNKKDATETVELLLEDARAGALDRTRDLGRRTSRRSSRHAASTSSSTRAGRRSTRPSARPAQPLGRPRVKLGTWAHLLEVGGRITQPGDVRKP